MQAHLAEPLPPVSDDPVRAIALSAAQIQHQALLAHQLHLNNRPSLVSSARAAWSSHEDATVRQRGRCEPYHTPALPISCGPKAVFMSLAGLYMQVWEVPGL